MSNPGSGTCARLLSPVRCVCRSRLGGERGRTGAVLPLLASEEVGAGGPRMANKTLEVCTGLDEAEMGGSRSAVG